jgi:hypothetical protein
VIDLGTRAGLLEHRDKLAAQFPGRAAGATCHANPSTAMPKLARL